MEVEKLITFFPAGPAQSCSGCSAALPPSRSGAAAVACPTSQNPYLLLHHVRVLEVAPQRPRALDPRVRQRTDLLAVEPAPLLPVELVVESWDELRVDEVDECVSHVAGVVIVDRQVEEVELHLEVPVQFLQQQLLGVLVRNVPHHQRRPPVLLDLTKIICTCSRFMRQSPLSSEFAYRLLLSVDCAYCSREYCSWYLQQSLSWLQYGKSQLQSSIWKEEVLVCSRRSDLSGVSQVQTRVLETPSLAGGLKERSPTNSLYSSRELSYYSLLWGARPSCLLRAFVRSSGEFSSSSLSFSFFTSSLISQEPANSSEKVLARMLSKKAQFWNLTGFPLLGRPLLRISLATRSQGDESLDRLAFFPMKHSKLSEEVSNLHLQRSFLFPLPNIAQEQQQPQKQINLTQQVDHQFSNLCLPPLPRPALPPNEATYYLYLFPLSGLPLHQSINDNMEKGKSLSLERKLPYHPVSETSITSQFVIRYEQRQLLKPKSNAQMSMSSKKHVRLSIPSYLKSTESSSAQLNRTRASSNLQAPKRKLTKMRSQEDEQDDKQYNRVPIQYYDERDHGCGADNARVRVVYRGYAPKNSYYFLKALKPSQSLKMKPFIYTVIALKNEHEIKFDSKFESGNLAAVSKINPLEYHLFMREDTNTHGLRQWYYFQAQSRKPATAKFRIYKFTKPYSLYRFGMKPYIRRLLSRSQGPAFSQWRQQGRKVRYEYDNYHKSYFLQFLFQFQSQEQLVEFAMLPPYTCSMLNSYLKQKQRDHLSETCKLAISELGQSLGGLPIHLIQISSVRKKKEVRQAVIILARTHPAQTVSNWTLESFIDKVLQIHNFTDYYDLFIIPMVNPDGVFVGNHRTSLIGQDLNRNFHSTDSQAFPEIEAVKQAVFKVRKSHKIRFLLDLHGHSARKNIFAYGSEYDIESNQYLHSRILPKILSQKISSFSYQFCVFREVHGKRNAARVHFSTKLKINSLTLEQSYGLLSVGPVGVQTWRNFGIALAESLLQFAQMYQNGREAAIEEYLKEEKAKEKQMLEQRLLKQQKLLGIVPQDEPKPQTDTIQQKEYKSIAQVGESLPKSFTTLKQKSATVRQLEQQSIPESRREEFQDEEVDLQNKLSDQEHIQEEEEKDGWSVKSSQLSSGDEELQLKDEQIQQIKRQIVRVGCLKQGLKRQQLNLADKKLQLYESESGLNKAETNRSGAKRLHEIRPTMPRMPKSQLQRYEPLAQVRNFKETQKSGLIQKLRQMQLPFLSR